MLSGPSDQILLMNDGAIVARGGHEELIGASPIYAALCGLSGDLSQSLNHPATQFAP